MNSNVVKKIESYSSTREELNKRRSAAIERFIVEFNMLYNDVLPIIKYMQEEKMYFFHPDLGNDVKSIHGPILGKGGPHGTIFIHDGLFARLVNYGDDTLANSQPIHINKYIDFCDRKMAYRGLNSLYNYLDGLLRLVEEEADDIEDLTQKLTQQREFRHQN